LALGLYVYAALAGACGAARGSQRLQRSARNALLAAFPATAVSAGALIVAFLRHDFSPVYVAQHSSLALPLAYPIPPLSGPPVGPLLGLVVCRAGARDRGLCPAAPPRGGCRSSGRSRLSPPPSWCPSRACWRRGRRRAPARGQTRA